MITKPSFFIQLGILTKRLILRVLRRPLAELPNIFISAFFLFVYDGASRVGLLAETASISMLFAVNSLIKLGIFPAPS